MDSYNCEQGSNEWHELRLARITGTKFKDLMSSKAGTAYNNMINDMVGQLIAKESEPMLKSSVMERGNEIEPAAREYYETTTGYKVKEVGFVTGDIYPEYVGVSPDGLIDKDGMVEIKCPLMKKHIEYLTGAKLPKDYYWQVHGQLTVTGRKWCDFVSYYPNMKPFILRVEYEKEIAENIESELKTAIELIKERLTIYNQYTEL